MENETKKDYIDSIQKVRNVILLLWSNGNNSERTSLLHSLKNALVKKHWKFIRPVLRLATENISLPFEKFTNLWKSMDTTGTQRMPIKLFQRKMSGLIWYIHLLLPARTLVMISMSKENIYVIRDRDKS